jgi:hypothetical protein
VSSAAPALTCRRRRLSEENGVEAERHYPIFGGIGRILVFAAAEDLAAAIFSSETKTVDSGAPPKC